MELGDLQLVVRTKDEEIHQLQESTNSFTRQQVATTVEIERYAKKVYKSMEMENHIDAYNAGNGREASSSTGSGFESDRNTFGYCI